MIYQVLNLERPRHSGVLCGGGQRVFTAMRQRHALLRRSLLPSRSLTRTRRTDIARLNREASPGISELQTL